MPARSRRYRALLTLLLAPAACFPAKRAPDPGNVFERVVTAKEIEASGATTAWEAVRRMLPNMGITGTSMNRRGKSSILLDDTPAVFVDGTRVAQIGTLGDIPAHTIATIRYLPGVHGTTHYGTNAGDGVIRIETKKGPGT